MRDPTRRSPGSWPRDRPIRWLGVAEGLGWFVASSAAVLVQLGLVIPVLAVAGSAAGDGLGGFARIGLALVWGGMTLLAAWSWLSRQWRVVAAPAVTLAVLFVVATVLPD